MNYAEWLRTVPAEITNDPIWKLEVYQLALFAADIGWEDVLRLSSEKLMFSIADQLHRSLDSISANLTRAAKGWIALDSLNIHLVQPVKAETGTTNLGMYCQRMSLNIVWNCSLTSSACWFQ